MSPSPSEIAYDLIVKEIQDKVLYGQLSSIASFKFDVRTKYLNDKRFDIIQRLSEVIVSTLQNAIEEKSLLVTGITCESQVEDDRTAYYINIYYLK